jgi:DNA-binding transcriptional MerR regulator
VEVAASDKLFFRIGEIAEILKLNSSVLRFWETQFDLLAPKKSRTGQRLYSKDDLEVLKEIRRLLYDEKMTIAGAKSRLLKRRSNRSNQPVVTTELLEEIRTELRELKQILEN